MRRRLLLPGGLLLLLIAKLFTAGVWLAMLGIDDIFAVLWLLLTFFRFFSLLARPERFLTLLMGQLKHCDLLLLRLNINSRLCPITLFHNLFLQIQLNFFLLNILLKLQLLSIHS